MTSRIVMNSPVRFDIFTSSPARKQLDQLHEHDLQPLFGMSIGLHDRLHARNVAMVIGAPDIDQQIIAALQLVPVIRDVGGEVGVFPVLFLDDAVFLVPKCRGPKPPGAVLFKHQPAGFQFIQHALDGL